MKRFILKNLINLIPFQDTRKILRNKILGSELPFEWKEYQRRMAYDDKVIYLKQDGTDVVYNELCKNKPSMICRYGRVELAIMTQLMRNKERKINFEHTKPIYFNAGFFPLSDYMLCRFASEMIEISKDIDVLGVHQSDEEYEAVKKYCDNAKLVEIVATEINSSNLDSHWLQYLKDKKVLVISPVAETIKSQYNKINLLFNNPLPNFDLNVIKAVQSIADEQENLQFTTWFEALEHMKKKIKQVDFDIALIGCGAYGIFLAHYCKSLGKKAVHMGGATQLLFGIKGKRWDDLGIYNEYWVRPSCAEIPDGAIKIEDGCYW